MFAFRHGPLARAETRFRARVLPRPTRFWRTVNVLFTAVTGIVAVGVLLYAALSPVLRTSSVVSDVEFLLLAGFALAALGMHYRVMFAMLTQSSAALARERRDTARWDALVLTGVRARDVVFGKWWVLVRDLLPTYAFLGLLRAAVVVWGGASFLTTGTFGLPPTVLVTSISTLAAAGVMLTLTLVNAPFTAACGVYAGMRFTRSALGAALAIRVIIGVVTSTAVNCLLSPILMLGTFAAAGLNIANTVNTPIGMLLQAIPLGTGTLGDNGLTLGGMVASGTLFTPGFDYSSGDVADAAWALSPGMVLVVVLALVLALAIYGFLTYSLLRGAARQAQKEGAL